MRSKAEISSFLGPSLVWVDKIAISVENCCHTLHTITMFPIWNSNFPTEIILWDELLQFFGSDENILILNISFWLEKLKFLEGITVFPIWTKNLQIYGRRNSTPCPLGDGWGIEVLKTLKICSKYSKCFRGKN